MAQNFIDSQNIFIPLYCRLPRNGVTENSINRSFFSGSLDFFPPFFIAFDEGRG